MQKGAHAHRVGKGRDTLPEEGPHGRLLGAKEGCLAVYHQRGAAGAAEFLLVVRLLAEVHHRVRVPGHLDPAGGETTFKKVLIP